MKKQYLLIAILVISFVATFLSCTHDLLNDDFEEIENVTNLGEINYSSVFTNKYDFVGEYHNEGLKYVFSKYSEQATSRASSDNTVELQKLIDEFCEENPIIPEATKIDSLISQNVISRSNEEGSYSKPKQQEYYNQLLALYKDESITSLQELVTRINKVELDVDSDAELTDDEKAQLLIPTAVAKYSAVFWAEQMSTDYHPSLKSRSEGGDDWLDWFDNVFKPNAENVLQADLHGAVVGVVTGFIYGGAVGSVVPGAGTITVGISAAVVNAARGALTDSVFAGIKIIWAAMFD